MIPKIIHYCWFGKGNFSELTLRCIESWKKYLPDYEIRLWDEERFDVESVRYTREAYGAHKYAFVADYVRLYALYQYGGIYFDTDVEVVKNFDLFLALDGFAGIEDGNRPACGVIGCKPGNPIISEFLNHYNGIGFFNDIGQYDMTPNPYWFRKILLRHGYKDEDICQNCDGFWLFPHTFFYPPKIDNVWKLSNDTCSIHHYDGSWAREKDQLQIQYEKEQEPYIKIFGHLWGERIYKNVTRVKKKGLIEWLKFCIKKAGKKD